MIFFQWSIQNGAPSRKTQFYTEIWDLWIIYEERSESEDSDSDIDPDYVPDPPKKAKTIAAKGKAGPEKGQKAKLLTLLIYYFGKS